LLALAGLRGGACCAHHLLPEFIAAVLGATVYGSVTLACPAWDAVLISFPQHQVCLTIVMLKLN
jgi:hypothetical protein